MTLMITEQFEDTILEFIEHYVQTRAKSAEGSGHDVYLAMQRLNQLCAPSVIYRMVMQMRGYRRTIAELEEQLLAHDLKPLSQGDDYGDPDEDVGTDYGNDSAGYNNDSAGYNNDSTDYGKDDLEC